MSARVVAYYLVAVGDPNWKDTSKSDLNGDGAIDIIDLRTVASKCEYAYVQ